jgi:addiction module HigA family antidote
MIATSRRPVSPGTMLTEEFMAPLALTQAALARAMGVERRLVNEICVGKRAVTADTALMLARVFGNTPDFWLNTQRRTDLWEALHDAKRRARIARAKPLARAALRA